MLLLTVVSLLWALSFGLIRHHLAGLDSTLVAAVRLLLALLVFLPFLRLRQSSWKREGLVFAIGAVQFGAMYLCYLRAFDTLRAFEVALLTVFTPVFIWLLEDALARRLRPLYLLASLLAVAGAALVFLPRWIEAYWPSGTGDADQAWQAFIHRWLGDSAFQGILLVQASNLCFALGQVAYRRWVRPNNAADERSLFAWAYLGAVVLTVPALAASPRAWASVAEHGQLSHLLVLAYLGVIASGVCFFWWNKGARRVNAGVLAAFNNAKAPLGALASVFVFGETLDPFLGWLGLALVAAALGLASWAGRREPVAA